MQKELKSWRVWDQVHLLLTPLKSPGLDGSQLRPHHCFLEEVLIQPIHSFIGQMFIEHLCQVQ